MTTDIEEKDKIEIIKSDNWELPLCNLGTGKHLWRPKTAFLPYFLFEGPGMTRRSHGINLNKDLAIGVHGPRGSTKTLTISYLVAKKLRLGLPAWTNWPVSFYVIEPTCWDACDRHDLCATCCVGHKTYYESFPLNMDKIYTFNDDLNNGVVGMTELQYYAEARTSGRGQNRFLTYQIMQLRKSALSFFYDVQNPRWSDNRFSWSDDIKIFCRDLSKMNYDMASVGYEIDEGEFGHWMVRDISGVCTGVQYEDSGMEYGPYQFDGYHFWHIYPTRWKIDVYDAVYSMKQKSDKADNEAKIGEAIRLAVVSFLDEGKYLVPASDMWARASSLSNMSVSPESGGRVLSNLGVDKKQNWKGKYIYNLSIFLPEDDNNKNKV